MKIAHETLVFLAEITILMFELIGVVIIIVAGIQGFIAYLRRKPFTRLNLAKGLAMALEFKLGSEIVRTVIVRDIGEILIVAAIIVLRAGLTFLINREIREQEAHYVDMKTKVEDIPEKEQNVDEKTELERLKKE